MVDVDYQVLAELAASAFFVVVSFSLLVRYKKASQQLSASTDLGRDLWNALDQRLKKQDERILDMMGKFEVIQLRSTESAVVTRRPPAATLVEEVPPAQMPEPARAEVRRAARVRMDPTERVVIGVLGQRPRSSVEIKELIGKSREHTARLMKAMFERGLVLRDDSKKPFVYELTEQGRRYLSAT